MSRTRHRRRAGRVASTSCGVRSTPGPAGGGPRAGRADRARRPTAPLDSPGDLMALLRRRRRTLVGGESYRDADHALMPIPPTGGLVSCQLRNTEGRPLPGVAVAVVETEGLRRVV